MRDTLSCVLKFRWSGQIASPDRTFNILIFVFIFVQMVRSCSDAALKRTIYKQMKNNSVALWVRVRAVQFMEFTLSGLCMWSSRFRLV